MIRHNTLKLIYTLLGLLLFVGQGAAGENVRYGVGARISGMNIGTTNFDTGDMGDIDAKFDNSMTLGLSLTGLYRDRFSLEMSLDQYETDLEVNHDSNSGVLGKFSQEVVLLTGRMHFRINERNGNFFLGGGAGYYNNGFNNLTRSKTEDFFALNLSSRVRDSYGMHLCAGAEYFFTRHIALNFDVKMILNQARFTFTPHTSSAHAEKDVSLNASFIGIGLKYYF
jgi:outer membrane protein W